MFYSSKEKELREFIKDKLQFSYFDLGDGWLIFDLPEADMGCHPSSAEEGKKAGTHNISFYCDDIEKTVAGLRERGVNFIDEITNEGYGLAINFKMPGEVIAQLYQPLYTKK